jgi:hypothetical protein
MNDQELIFRAVTILLTIIGWIVLFCQQREINNFQKEKEKRDIIRDKVKTVREFINEYATLRQLYQYKLLNLDYAIIFEDTKTRKLENGNYFQVGDKIFISDENEQKRVNQKLFTVDEKFVQGVKLLKGEDIENLILHQRTSIILKTSEIYDITDELDNSGRLKELLQGLHEATIDDTEKYLEHPENYNAGTLALKMYSKKIDEQRTKLIFELNSITSKLTR